MSNSTTGIPAFAKCAAMRDPIVPAPRTAARRIKGCPEWDVSDSFSMARAISKVEIVLFIGTPVRQVSAFSAAAKHHTENHRSIMNLDSFGQGPRLSGRKDWVVSRAIRRLTQ